VVKDSQLFEISPSNEMIYLRDVPDGAPIASPTDLYGAWIKSETLIKSEDGIGVWLSFPNESNPTCIFSHPAGEGFWSPDGNSLFFFGEAKPPIYGYQRLYVARTPDFSPELLHPDLTISNWWPEIFWLQP
jgi:hypothetical protein